MLKKTSSMDMPLDFTTWTVKETCQYLEKEGLGQWAQKFKGHQITGDCLQGLTVANLKGMGIDKPKDCEKILLCIAKLWQIPGKVINDPIHGHVELHPLLIKIIDTPQFQRLRYMKQLGGAYFVYPGASHNRFEHSIGVAHLAGELVKSLKARQPELGITDRDMLCVQIAGLCHDLGHGPFSHMFDSMFIPKVRPNTTWKHEDASCAMFDYLVKNNGLKKEMKKYGLELPKDQVFIKEMIVGPLDSKAQERLQAAFWVLKEKVKDHGVELKDEEVKEITVELLDNIIAQEQLEAGFRVLKEKVKTRYPDVELKEDPTFIKEIITPFWLVKEKMVKAYGIELPDDLDFIKEGIGGLLDSGTAKEQWPYKGRTVDKSFLYEIVANKTTGIDVDKFDYFARDCYHLGLKNNFDYRRFLKFARVCEVEDNRKKQICIRDKEVYNLYNMFHTRYCIHRGACQHKVSSIIQTMMADAFVKADKHIQIEGSDGTYTLSGAIDDMEAYTKLTDCVFEQILNFPSKDLTGDQKKDMGEAKQILHRIITRDLYRCLGEIGIKPSIHEEGICGDLKKTGPPDGMEPRDAEAASSTHGKEIYEKLKKKVTDLEPEDFAVVPISMDYGMEHEDPIENVRFYSKNEPNKGFKIEREQVSNVLPTYFSDDLVRVYYKGTDEEKLKTAKEKFEKWWDNYEKAVRFEECSKKCRSRNGDCVWKMYRLNRPQSQRTPESNTEESIKQ